MSDKSIAKHCSDYFYDITEEVITKLYSHFIKVRPRGITLDTVYLDEISFIYEGDYEE